MVKTIKFDKSKYIGDPINAVRIFNDKEVDELTLLDIDASKENRGPNFDLIEQLATECFMPLAYGGGVRNLEDIQRLISLGIEKVVLNTAALTDLELISSASKIFGEQSILVSIDVTKNFWGKYQVFSHSKTKHNWNDLENYVKAVISAGAGEILLNSVDKDGTMSGYDIQLIHQITSIVPVPVVACGGAGKVEDFDKALTAGASAVAAGSLFVFYGPHKAVLINYPSELRLMNQALV